MKRSPAHFRDTGLTGLEVLLALACLAIVLLLIFSSAAACNRTAKRVHCRMGLKQVALGLGLWANEHQERFPMELPASFGGTREDALAGNLLPNLLIASNQFHHYPGILACPSDEQRPRATNFTSLTTTNISYFLNVDAAYTNQTHVIAGDRDITSGRSLVHPGLLTIRNPLGIGWGSVLHTRAGNVALVDGSGHQLTAAQLRNLLSTGLTNRLIIP